MDSIERINLAHKLWFAEYGTSRDPVPHLFHYTTVDGLNGILQSASIYGSHVLYLNDSSEVRHAFEFGRSVLESLTTADSALGVGGDQLKPYGSFFFSSANVLWREDAYVTSFCEDGDLLSQWRGYGMGGFAICFSPHSEGNLHLLSKAVWKTTIQKVAYVDAEKRESLLRMIAAGVKATAKAAGDKDLENTIATLTSLELQTWIHTSKDKSFEEEREWRIISYVMPNGAPLRSENGFVARVASNQLVPSIRLTAAKEGRLLPILGVKCGPNPSKALTEKAVTLLLSSYGYPVDQVSSSRIPFRSHY